MTSSSAITLGRVRFFGRGARRDLLEDAIGRIRDDDVGLGNGEVLFVPRLRSRTPLGSASRQAFAAQVGTDLRQITAQALRDPPPGSGGERPMRFSSPAAFAAWLIGAVLGAPADRAEALVRAATGRPSPSAWWRGDILPSGRMIVALLPRLARAGLAARWLARLEIHDIALATGSVEQDYECDIVGSEPPPVAPSPSRAAAPPAHRGGEAGFVLARLVAAARRELAVPDPGTVSLPPTVLRLLLAAEVLARAPAAPRRELAAALAAETVAPLREAARVRAADAVDAPPAIRPVGQEPPAPTGAARHRDRYPPAPVAAPVPRRATPGRAPVAVAEAAATVPVAPSPTRPPASIGPLPLGEPREAVRVSAASVPPPAPADPVAAAELISPDAAFDTAFGGMAFLLNAFLAMDLYPDFTRPLDKGLAIAPFALVDAIGRRWFGKRWHGDALHRWVRERGPAAPLPQRWRVPRDWLRPFAARHAWHCGTTLWHPAGFPLANRVGPVAARRAARALGLRLAAAPIAAPGNPDWTGCLALFLAARLQRAGPVTPQDLALPARVIAMGDKLVFHFPLDRLPLAIRIAGLDRDLGWLPSEGRDVRFVFA